jgi:hypothetical protein
MKQLPENFREECRNATANPRLQGSESCAVRIVLRKAKRLRVFERGSQRNGRRAEANSMGGRGRVRTSIMRLAWATF